MEVLLTKLLTRLVSPLGLSILLMGVAAVLSLLNRKRLASSMCLLAMAILWFPSTPIVAGHLSMPLERAYPPVSVKDTPQADAIVVLGGAVGPVEPPRLTVDLISTSDRVLHAARLYRAGKAPRVIASGGAWLEGATPESEAISELLQEWGVPESAVILETGSLNTRQNAVETKKIFEELRLDSLLLVTSALHMPRALATFQSMELDVVPIPTDVETVDGLERTILDWIPNIVALEKSSCVIREYLGLVAYWWRGWIGQNEAPRTTA